MIIRDELRYGQPMHQRVLEAILARRDFSQEKLRDRYEKWRKDDEAAIAYIPEKENDRIRRQELHDRGEPQFLTLKVPFDYAVLMSMHTYLTSVFLGRNPVLQYLGRQGQSQNAVMAVESIMDYQLLVGRMLPPLYAWLADAGRYGVGFTGNYWNDQRVVVNEEVEVPESFLGIDLGTTRKEMQRKVVPGYMGNKLFNVRPYDMVPDPRVPFIQMQDGEFCGRYTTLNWNQVAKGASNGQYFNIEALREQRMRGARRGQEGSPNIPYPVRPDDEYRFDRMSMGAIDLLEMYVELIPRDWHLGNSTYPEKWAFAVANDEVVVAAQPMGLYHDKFPFYALEMEVDAYSIFKRSMLEIVGPMTDVLTWLFNTHFYNTRKSLNDMFVVDPMKVVVKDLLDPKPGKVIRLKEEMYGQDVRSAIWQFPVQNVTQQHLADAQVVSSLIQRVSGVNDAIMGLANQGGRKTATEVRTSSTFGVNRLKTIAEYMSATGFTDMSQTMLQATQQLMSETLKVRIAGDMLQHRGAERALEVRPEEIQGFYDFTPVDGTLPVDRFAQVTMWSQLLQQMGQAPAVLAQYDLGRIFAFVAQLGGLKNINQFRIDIEDPVALQQQAAAGNVIPMESRRGGNRPREAGEPPVASTGAGVGVAA